jgi:hypothetical protein
MRRPHDREPLCVIPAEPASRHRRALAARSKQNKQPQPGACDRAEAWDRTQSRRERSTAHTPSCCEGRVGTSATRYAGRFGSRAAQSAWQPVGRHEAIWPYQALQTAHRTQHTTVADRLAYCTFASADRKHGSPTISGKSTTCAPTIYEQRALYASGWLLLSCRSLPARCRRVIASRADTATSARAARGSVAMQSPQPTSHTTAHTTARAKHVCTAGTACCAFWHGSRGYSAYSAVLTRACLQEVAARQALVQREELRNRRR